MTDDSSRQEFEELAFRDFYVRSIVRNPNKPVNAIAGCLDFVPGNTTTKVEFCHRDEDGNYVRSDVSAMWHGWKLAKNGIT